MLKPTKFKIQSLNQKNQSKLIIRHLNAKAIQILQYIIA